MSFISQTFEDFKTSFIAAFASKTGVTPVLGIADPLEGLADAEATNAIFLQFQAQSTTFFARLQTCFGPDVDSFCAQFNFFRAGAQFASGQVTLAVPLPVVTQLVIPIGTTIIQTPSGSIQYQLVADTNQPTYSASLRAYVLAANGPTTLVASVKALVAGSVDNVQEGQLNTFGSSPYGFTSVTNLAPIVNGADEQSDADFKAAFENYIQSLSKGTYLALLSACQQTFPEFTYTILNVNPYGQLNALGQPIAGWFTVIANDPGQTVSSDDTTTLFNALQNIRAFPIQYSVIAAIPVTPVIQLDVSVLPNTVIADIEAAVQTAIIGYVNSLPTGAKLYISNLITVAKNTSSLITSVENLSVTIDSRPDDFQPDQFGVVQANVNTVIVGVYSG